jgi:hypothetical protein
MQSNSPKFRSISRTVKSTGARLLLSAAAIGAGASASFAASFSDDVAFLKKHTDVTVLSDPSGKAQVAVVGAWQGRVMTSTATGKDGISFGWLNRERIASSKVDPHINVFGGEDRFWLGPEGGQYSIFFAPGAKFDLAHWFTPPQIDMMPYKALSTTKTKAVYQAAFAVTNFSGTKFSLKVGREVRLLNSEATWTKLGFKPEAGVDLVGFESHNKITNTGKKPWQKDTGLLSIWILGMFNPSPATTVVVPITPGSEESLGKKVTSDYFGEVPKSRLVTRDDVLYFSADGQYRSKIGISPKRSRGLLGSYDAANKVLTLVYFTQPAGVTDYVNSLWKLQDNPFGGDASNSYNDGPPSPGAKPLGPFYELESSSPAAALKPGASLTHVHRTLHFSGAEEGLDKIARATLGRSLAEITKALPRR